MHGSPVVAAQALRLGNPRLFQRLIGQEQDERVESIVGLLDAFEAGPGQLHRGELTIPDQLAGLVNGQEMEFGIGSGHSDSSLN